MAFSEYTPVSPAAEPLLLFVLADFFPHALWDFNELSVSSLLVRVG